MAGEPTFSPSIAPSYPFTDSREPRVLTNEYGDGYIERAGDGINTDRADLSLTWMNVTKAERDEIFNFLKARGGAEAFLWTAPDEVSASKYIAPTYKSEKIDAGVYIVTATFVQVYDL